MLYINDEDAKIEQLNKSLSEIIWAEVKCAAYGYNPDGSISVLSCTIIDKRFQFIIKIKPPIEGDLDIDFISLTEGKQKPIAFMLMYDIMHSMGGNFIYNRRRIVHALNIIWPEKKENAQH